MKRISSVKHHNKIDRQISDVASKWTQEEREGNRERKASFSPCNSPKMTSIFGLAHA